MEFLAESIGLLDIGGGGAYASPNPHQEDNTGSAENRSSSYFGFFPWGGFGGTRSEDVENAESAVYPRQELNGGYASGDIGGGVASETEAACQDTSLGEEYGDVGRHGAGESSNSFLASRAPAPSPALTESSVDCTHLDEESQVEPSTFAAAAPTMHTTVSADNVLTKFVTERIDARTGYDCFTGNIDAVTGDLIQGTMLYRKTGVVYEGAFVTGYKADGLGSSTTSHGQIEEERSCDTISLRHGRNATCLYPNGMKFVGSFEFDRPTCGTWFGGKDWTYDGHFDLDDRPSRLLPSSSSGSDIGGSVASQGTSNVIGISHQLPEPVFFHGKGRFVRSDGLSYEGEFANGLAHGVGKEVIAGGDAVYCGEFSDGLRHGVGTLMEIYYEDDRESLEACSCACQHSADSDHPLDAQKDEGVHTGPDFAAGCAPSHFASTSDTEDDASSSESSSGGNASSSHNNETPCSTEHPSSLAHASMVRICSKCKFDYPPMKRKRQRYSSGVWCAGQYEIQDFRGTVHPQMLQWDEHSNAPIQNEKSAMGETATLNRTTWDLLDEKWLGI